MRTMRGAIHLRRVSYKEGMLLIFCSLHVLDLPHTLTNKTVPTSAIGSFQVVPARCRTIASTHRGPTSNPTTQSPLHPSTLAHQSRTTTRQQHYPSPHTPFTVGHQDSELRRPKVGRSPLTRSSPSSAFHLGLSSPPSRQHSSPSSSPSPTSFKIARPPLSLPTL